MNSRERLPIVFIACGVFQGIIDRLLSSDGEPAGRVTFLDAGLHAVPKKLNRALQEAIDGIAEPSLVVLGYGLCGNGLKGIKAGRHALLVPRADDCITMFLGSRAAYREQFEAAPGSYYLTKGWLDSGSTPLAEYQKYVPRFGEETAMWMMDAQYSHYRRLVLVAHNAADLAQYRPAAQEVAAFCARWGLEYVEILGSEDYLRRLIETAAALDLSLSEDGKDFFVIPPGGEIKQEMYEG